MKKYLLFFLFFTTVFSIEVKAQPASISIPVSIGRNNCGDLTGGSYLYQNPNNTDHAYSFDSLYLFDYTAQQLKRSTLKNAYFPRLRIGNTTYANGGNTYRDRFNIWSASVAFNPKDGKIYYTYVDMFNAVSSTVKSYIWRWNPDTTFATAPSTPYAGATTTNLLDTIASFTTQISGIAFANNGNGYQFEYGSTSPYKTMLRKIDLVAKVVSPIADTLDLIPGAGGIGDTIFAIDGYDLTLTPNGQMYYVLNNKLYTPDYGSYGNPTHHINSTYIDTIKQPISASFLLGLAYADGDLVSAYYPGCIYGKIDPVNGDTSNVNYTYAASKGVASIDMTQIASGLGVAKKLVSIVPTGVPKQYDVVYDVLVKNYGSTPLTNLQIKDSLGGINGNANVSNVSTSMLTIPPPPGIALNMAYNGVTNTNLLFALGQKLPNFPIDSNNFTIRISCRISNVDTGKIYYNSAVGFANGFKNIALRDSSTNGPIADLNQNDKPDDVGESVPTPFLVAIVPTSPPCATLTSTLYTENFGSGAGMSTTLPGSFITTYTPTTTNPMPRNTFTFTNNARLADTANFISMTDHTGGTNGKMMLFNADAPPRVFFRDTMPTSCPGRQYSLSFWGAFPANSTYATACTALGGFRYPKVAIRFIDIVTGLDVVQRTVTDSFYSPGWVQKGIKWTMPAGYSNLILEISNAAPGGCGNDLAIDDIVYGTCDALPTVTTSSLNGCLGDSVTFVGALTDSSVFPGPKQQQWQIASSLAGPWTDIAGKTAPTLTINPITAADTGKFYRLAVAANGSIGISICRSVSPGVKLIGQVPSVAATSAGKNKNNICPGIPVKIYRTGGSLGSAASWKWYSGSCNGTLVGTGDTLTVTPSVNTNYYVRAEGTCNNTVCQVVSVNISCDIDKDDDGVPDLVESNMTAAWGDVNGNGVINAYDIAYAGFKDNNNDYIDDDFQADADSDNDGIANYLDTDFPGRVDANSDGVDDRFDRDLDGKTNMLDLDSDNDGITDVAEQGGVDANGDGKIDNFTDTDGDGLSQNVDGVAGAYNTGLGLSYVDIDGDGVPNYLDADSDNDGIPDVREVFADDINNDGIIDGFVDTNADGLHDSYINATALLITGADTDSDGRANSYPNKNLDGDLRANPYDVDSDNDGITDVREAELPDTAPLDGFVDAPYGADGWSDAVDALAALTLPNTDGRGNPNYLDIDSDDDGIPDNIEAQITANPLPSTYKIPAYTDVDNDGMDTQFDNRPAVFGATGIVPVDTDGDNTPDYKDLDTDADGQPDRIEGNDFNRNGIADDNVTLTLLDTDGDGLDNRFDSSNTTLKGTSYNLATGGGIAGDAAPGARCPVQRKLVAQTDRDWRFAGAVLQVQFLQFTGNPQNNNVWLSWSIIADKAIDHFEVERSTNNTTYTKIGVVNDNVLLNIQQGFTYNDDISNVNSDIIYYRLKVIAKTGEIIYSNILVVRKYKLTQLPITVMPVPATNFVNINIELKAAQDVLIKLINAEGKTVVKQSFAAAKGSNTLRLDNLNRYSKGNYVLVINANDEVTIKKIVLQ